MGFCQSQTLHHLFHPSNSRISNNMINCQKVDLVPIPQYMFWGHMEREYVFSQSQENKTNAKLADRKAKHSSPRLLFVESGRRSCQRGRGPELRHALRCVPALLPLGSAHRYPRTRWLPPNHRVCRNPKWKWKRPKHIRSPGPMERDFMQDNSSRRFRLRLPLCYMTDQCFRIKTGSSSWLFFFFFFF